MACYSAFLGLPRDCLFLSMGSTILGRGKNQSCQSVAGALVCNTELQLFGGTISAQYCDADGTFAACAHLRSIKGFPSACIGAQVGFLSFALQCAACIRPLPAIASGEGGSQARRLGT